MCVSFQNVSRPLCFLDVCAASLSESLRLFRVALIPGTAPSVYNLPPFFGRFYLFACVSLLDFLFGSAVQFLLALATPLCVSSRMSDRQQNSRVFTQPVAWPAGLFLLLLSRRADGFASVPSLPFPWGTAACCAYFTRSGTGGSSYKPYRPSRRADYSSVARWRQRHGSKSKKGRKSRRPATAAVYGSTPSSGRAPGCSAGRQGPKRGECHCSDRRRCFAAREGQVVHLQSNSPTRWQTDSSSSNYEVH
eukprot:GHVT01094892.1.p2 GENE.GHVT01094892.1~~GHVT01094892.1.p2  ORF type:complete len:249 (+),score=21.82 GHVT01094892.1:392-1138(+)